MKHENESRAYQFIDLHYYHLVLAMAVAFLTVSVKIHPLLLGGVLIVVISVVCYLRAPVAYAIEQDALTVIFRLGKAQFSPIVSCSLLTQPIPPSMRLWGNGGLFAATGVFWNKAYGTFRVYLTNVKPANQVLVETTRQKILISPEQPEVFMAACLTPKETA